MKIVTSYSEPDLDGVSCMYAYSELLNKQGEDVKYFIWNTPKQEVKIVCNMFNIELDSINESDINEDGQYIVVDLNRKEEMYNKISNDNIYEIIDHHGISNWLPQYTKISRVQIDRLGAAATIVTERFKQAGITPSRESAILLYYGIISNSINLKASITNKRDIEACFWLQRICPEISDEKIAEIFAQKSIIDVNNLRQEMECEIPIVFPDFKLIIAQLEIANMEDYLKTYKQDIINVMREVKEEKNVDYVFINCVDILNGYIIIFALDTPTEDFIKRTYGFEFDENNIIKINKIIQRKDLTKVLREKYG